MSSIASSKSIRLAELARRQMANYSGMIKLQTYEDGAEIGRRMVNNLKQVHFAVSLGHLRSVVYWIGAEDILKSTYRHPQDPEVRFRCFRLSVGLEHTDDICADIGRCP